LTLVSLDTKGSNKTMGGDEYYVTYTDASSIIKDGDVSCILS
jgi:hypothetical protein